MYVPITGAENMLPAVIALGVVCAVFVIGFVVAIGYVIWIKRKPRGLTNSLLFCGFVLPNFTAANFDQREE